MRVIKAMSIVKIVYIPSGLTLITVTDDKIPRVCK